MISDITLGQFFPGNSIIHRLDPRTKIILTVMFIVAVFMASNPAAFLLLLSGKPITTPISESPSRSAVAERQLPAPSVVPVFSPVAPL